MAGHDNPPRRRHRQPSDPKVSLQSPSRFRTVVASPGARAWTVLCSARPGTLRCFHRVLALLMCIEFADRWSATGLLYSVDRVGGEAAPLAVLEYLDTVEWRPIVLLAVASAVAATASAAALPAIGLLVLYVSLSLRAPTFMWILDRYAHTLLLISAILPRVAQHASPSNSPPPPRAAQRSDGCEMPMASGVVALARLQVCWIYVDAAIVKWQSGAWWCAAPTRLSALDVYLRHTAGSALFRRMAALTPLGEGPALRVLSSATVVIELGAPALLLIACGCQPRARRWLARGSLALLGGLHAAIATTMSGTVLLSAMAALALVLWADVALPDAKMCSGRGAASLEARLDQPRIYNGRRRTGLLAIALASCASFEVNRALSASGDGDHAANEAYQTRRVLLGNRWNVFGPAAPYITWEIAPGKLADGSVTDVWRASEVVSWSVPGPRQALRHSRYRMVPFLSGRAKDGGDVGQRFWEAVCLEWNRRQPATRRLVRFKFFMLSAELLSEGREGKVGKALVRDHLCNSSSTPVSPDPP